ncbi:Zinc finger, PMZ-type [Sesbania bispinosa]|nr:Zinc finger, PMZ-type [Sesbania bispinosa]
MVKGLDNLSFSTDYGSSTGPESESGDEGGLGDGGGTGDEGGSSDGGGSGNEGYSDTWTEYDGNVSDYQECSASDGRHDTLNDDDMENATKIGINSMGDIGKIDLVTFSPHLITKYDFPSLDMAYKFYCRYAKANGFSVRRGRILRSKKTGEALQQDLWCSNKGFREDRGLKMEDRKREIRPETRCDCRANFRIHVDKVTNRWYATVFYDEHSHPLLDKRYSGMLPGHRKMSESDIIQMNSLLQAGISPAHIFGHFALQCGGYEKVGFRLKDIYNQIERQRRKQCSDAMAAIEYLGELGKKDEIMYCEHTIDEEGDYDVGEFRQKWIELVSKLGLQEHPWVKKIYDSRSKWASAYFRGNFFAGFRTTSRCESLHAELGKYVHSRYNLTDFLQHYHRCLSHMRYKEMADDFCSLHGVPVLQSKFPAIEKSAGKHYTRRVLNVFRVLLNKAGEMIISDCKEMLMSLMYTVCKRGVDVKVWRVSFYPSTYEFKCSCLWMESRGLPCEHIIAVMHHLNIEELPKSLVLRRWSKGAKDGIQTCGAEDTNCWDTHKICRKAVLSEYCDIWIELNADTYEEFNEAKESIARDIEGKKAKKAQQNMTGTSTNSINDDVLRNPLRASTKGRGTPSSSSWGVRVKRRTHCSYCKQSGHNRVTCPAKIRNSQMTQTTTSSLHHGDDETGYYESEGFDHSSVAAN